jgi:hypothetical protein
MGTFITTRYLLSLWVAISLPLCCCTFDALCAADAATPTHVSDSAATVRDAGTPSGCCHHEDRLPDQQPSPTHHPKKDGCVCGGDDKLVSLEVKPLPNFEPTALVGFLLLPSALHPVSMQAAAVRFDAALPLRPPQSLLRMHCALVV